VSAPVVGPDLDGDLDGDLDLSLLYPPTEAAARELGISQNASVSGTTTESGPASTRPTTAAEETRSSTRPTCVHWLPDGRSETSERVTAPADTTR
jgi:hypothetical protein